MSTTPPKTIIITGISPHSPLSTHIANLLLAHFTSTTPSATPNGTSQSPSSSSSTFTPTIQLALLGPSLPHLEQTISQLSHTFPSPSIKILPFEVAITSAQSIGITAHTIRASFGASDIVIHNAPAFLSPRDAESPIRGADEDEWWEVFEVNVRSIQSMARHFFTKMRGGAVFVNVLAWRDVAGDTEGVGEKGRSAWEGSGVAAEQVMGHLMGENRGFRCHSVYVRQDGGESISEEEWRESAKKVTVGLNCW